MVRFIQSVADLMFAFPSGDVVVIESAGYPNNMVTGRLLAIELEDGSGRSFIVTLCLADNSRKKVYVRFSR